MRSFCLFSLTKAWNPREFKKKVTQLHKKQQKLNSDYEGSVTVLAKIITTVQNYQENISSDSKLNTETQSL